jgi:hypothetical protein
VSPRQIAGRLRGQALFRMLRGWAHTGRLLRAAGAPSGSPAPAAPRRARPSSLAGLSRQVASFADQGASSSEIARRTGLTHDAIALILHFRQSAGAEISTGGGTIYRAEPASPSWVAEA